MSLQSIARNLHGDDLLKVLGPLAHHVTSPHFEVHADQSQYACLIAGGKRDCALRTYSLLKPSIFTGFKNVLVASACMEDTMFHRLFTARGIVLEPVTGKLVEELRYQSHEHGDRIVIRYASEEAWSKRFRDRTLGDGSATVLDQVRTAVGGFVGDEPFAWMGNVDLPKDFFPQAGAVRLPNTPHGLNEFQHLHAVVVLSALNPPPVHFHFMEGLGISGDEVRTAHYRTAVYQAVMRISIRNPADTTHKGVVVMDRDTAEWLADLFPGAEVEPLDGMGVLPRKGKAGRPRKHATGSDRVRAHREQEKRKLLAQLDLINATSLITGRYPFFDQEVRAGMRELACNEFPLIERDSVTPQAAPQTCGTAFASIYDRVPLDHVDYEDDDAFVAGLGALHGRVVAKDEAGLFSPAHFDPDKAAGTGRGLDNITHLRGVWLDNDGGDLTHAAFAGLFPHLRVVVWNTASSTAENPRWRAFIPTTCAMSLDVYGLILAQIVKVLNRAGYWGTRQLEKRPGIKGRLCHGFDEGKFNGASLFYLPCQAKDPAHSFFIDYGEGDSKRGPLDLHAWIDGCILSLRPEPDPQPVPPVPVPQPTAMAKATCAKLQAVRDELAAKEARSLAGQREARVTAANTAWQATAYIPGTGNNAFFRLGAALKGAGLDAAEIKAALYEQAAYARSPRERRAEIKGILKSLGRRGTINGGGR